jgi:hypothetical protein
MNVGKESMTFKLKSSYAKKGIYRVPFFAVAQTK